MSVTDLRSTTAQALLDDLDPEVITQRLEELDRETRALRVLLRATRARKRREAKATHSREVALAR